MPMPPYSASCLQPGCVRPAVYKIAARWSDGVTHELKTYALCCEECLAEWLQRSWAKQAACRLAAGETLGLPGVYEMVRGQRDQQLARRHDLEERLSSSGDASGDSTPS